MARGAGACVMKVEECRVAEGKTACMRAKT